MQRFLPAFLAAVLALAACATSSPKLPPNYVSGLRAKGVGESTLQRVQNGRVLTYNDIMDLVRHRVPTSKIIAYLKATQAPYSFNTSQLEALKRAGASQDLIGYLMGSAAFYSNNPYLGEPYYTDPGFMGPPPFGWDGFGDPFFY